MIEALGGDGAHSEAAQGCLRGLPITSGLEAIGNGRIAVMGMDGRKDGGRKTQQRSGDGYLSVTSKQQGNIKTNCQDDLSINQLS